MAQLFAASPANNLPDVPNYNVCPTTQVHVVRRTDTGRSLTSMRWGFLPHWYKSETAGPLLINARGETLADKPAFRSACRTRRCLIISTGFYEWTKSPTGARLPWYIHRRDAAPIAFAAVWQDWGIEETQATCAIVTVAANQNLSAIHHRMPVVLEPKDWPMWLGETGKGAATLMRPGPEDILTFHRVDPAVNSNRSSGAQLIAPLIINPPAA